MRGRKEREEKRNLFTSRPDYRRRRLEHERLFGRVVLWARAGRKLFTPFSHYTQRRHMEGLKESIHHSECDVALFVPSRESSGGDSLTNRVGAIGPRVCSAGRGNLSLRIGRAGGAGGPVWYRKNESAGDIDGSFDSSVRERRGTFLFGRRKKMSKKKKKMFQQWRERKKMMTRHAMTQTCDSHHQKNVLITKNLDLEEEKTNANKRLL